MVNARLLECLDASGGRHLGCLAQRMGDFFVLLDGRVEALAQLLGFLASAVDLAVSAVLDRPNVLDRGLALHLGVIL